MMDVPLLCLFLLLCTRAASSCDIISNGASWNCSRRGLTEIPSPTTTQMIKNIYLSYNNISRIRVTSFGKFRNLRTIDMSYNNIFDIETSAFENMTRLTNLYLKRNALRFVTNETFRGARKLLLLDLSYNLITSLHDGTFAGLPLLKSLILDNNHIQSIQPGAFSSLDLRVLKLNRNNLTAIENAFDRLLVVKIILSDNKIENVSYNVFDGVDNLQTVHLSRNPIQSIDMARWPESVVNVNIWQERCLLRYVTNLGENVANITGCVMNVDCTCQNELGLKLMLRNIENFYQKCQRLELCHGTTAVDITTNVESTTPEVVTNSPYRGTNSPFNSAKAVTFTVRHTLLLVFASRVLFLT